MSRPHDLVRLVVGAGAVAAATGVFLTWLPGANPTTVALTFLLVVLIVAATSSRATAIAISIVATIAFNYFFLPPVRTLTVNDPQNWVALTAFLAVSLVASHLSALARARAEESRARRDEVARLFDLSRDVLVMSDSRQAIAGLAGSIARRFDLEYVAIALPRSADWDLFEAGPLEVELDRHQLTMQFANARGALEFDARSRTYGGHATQQAGDHAVRVVPLRVGAKPTGLLAAAGRPVDPGTLDALAGIVAIGLERAQFLEERKSAELTRQSEELKTTLLASIGHDLRTPLTAIRVAASNLRGTWLGEDARREQADVILVEVERLTRLFQNILEMARIDSGAIASDPQWVHPAEVVAAARDQVEHSLRGHELDVRMEADGLARIDPRLTASALAQVLENAAHYAPPSSPIDIAVTVRDGNLVFAVRDRGPGIASADLPHLFERFYRGEAAGVRASGTGMGLSIARGLLAAEKGRIWAENRAGGGAEFSMAIPAEIREPASAT